MTWKGYTRYISGILFWFIEFLWVHGILLPITSGWICGITWAHTERSMLYGHRVLYGPRTNDKGNVWWIVKLHLTFLVCSLQFSTVRFYWMDWIWGYYFLKIDWKVFNLGVFWRSLRVPWTMKGLNYQMMRILK